MEKDRRYKLAKIMIDGGHIYSFPEIFTIIPVSIVAKDLRKNNLALSTIISDPGRWQIKHLIVFSELLEVDIIVLLTLLLKPMKQPRKKKAVSKK